MDGHKSHIKYELRELAKQHSIEITKLPSHTKHVLQPLDVSKEAYDTVAHNFFHTHQRYINKRDFPAILATAWKAFKPEMAINGFRTTGIPPFNKDAVEASSIHLSAPYQHHSQANEDPVLEQLPPHSEKPPSTDRELMDDPVESNTYELDPTSTSRGWSTGSNRTTTQQLRGSLKPSLPHPHTLPQAPQHRLQAQNVPNTSMTPSCSNTPQTPGISLNMPTEESHKLRDFFTTFLQSTSPTVSKSKRQRGLA